ncbi:DUF2934 domain-containing protein [Pseudomonas capeferrum]|uniref:DUF2934 domain-containing protein n=1 Tax=Pseudomonas capeferrum TaxID=1495066 RepID=UPI0015E3C498|nr:DUF2934 domain-containing protein [Pseudomonas capeferrum]MBA1200634.1 DUF2934 domain-containing protein [Pseudomonas capeferrum]
MSVDDKRIREFAYQIWESEGKPEGEEERHWDMARKLAEAEASAPKAVPRKKSAAKPKADAASKTAAQPKGNAQTKAVPSPAEKPAEAKKPRAVKKSATGST